MDEGAHDQTARNCADYQCIGCKDCLPKLAGNQNVRNTENGKRAKETERNDPERVVETDDLANDWVPTPRPLATALADLENAVTEPDLNQAFANASGALYEWRGRLLREITERYDPRCTPEG